MLFFCINVYINILTVAEFFNFSKFDFAFAQFIAKDASLSLINSLVWMQGDRAIDSLLFPSLMKWGEMSIYPIFWRGENEEYKV